MRLFKPLAIASTIATFVLVAIGGLVRATKSGLGCGTDWPHCSGTLVPALEQRAQIIEFSHRAAAGVVVILLGLVALIAVMRYRDDRKIMWTSVGAFGLVMWQAVLGAIVVKLELQAISVVLHLGTALSLLALLIYLVFGLLAAPPSVSPAPGRVESSISKRSAFAAASVLILLLLGSYVSGSGAGYVFDDWPLMNGRVIPDLSFRPQAIHFLHRALAGIVGVVVFVVAWGVMKRKDEMPAAARFAHIAAGLYAVEVMIGAANVWTELNAAFVTAHLAVGAAIWTSLVGMAVVTREARASETATMSDARPVLES